MSAVTASPRLTADDLAAGRGLQFIPGAVDNAATNKDKIRGIRRKALEHFGHQKGTCINMSFITTMPRLKLFCNAGLASLVGFNKIIQNLDQKDKQIEGLNATNSKLREYNMIGHPYMRDYCISPDMSYQFIMSPFMSKVMADADFLQTDVTYGENKILPYLFNATVFDEVTMKWVIVARLRCNKENAEMYKKAFTLMFDTCRSDEPSYDEHKNLQGIVIDWSDTERSGIIKALGSELASKLLRGCAVHWTRSYQRVAVRVSTKSSIEMKQKVREAFEHIAQAIPNLANENQVQQCFAALKGSVVVSSIAALVPKLTGDHVSAAEACSTWSFAKAWVDWWTRPYHLKMLCKCLSDMSLTAWSTCPSTTNAVERLNLASKAPQAISMMHAMVDVYRMDKAVVMEHQAAQEGISISYRDR